MENKNKKKCVLCCFIKRILKYISIFIGGILLSYLAGYLFGLLVPIEKWGVNYQSAPSTDFALYVMVGFIILFMVFILSFTLYSLLGSVWEKCKEECDGK